MIFEILTTTVMGGIALKAHLSKTGSSNDSAKIQKIFSLSGLNVKDGSETLTAQLVKRKSHQWGTEYRYRIPLGRSFDDYKAKLRTLEDGLNNKQKVSITLRDLRSLKFDEKFLQSIKTLWKGKLAHRKELELSFDGMLILRIYNEPMPKKVYFSPAFDWKVRVGITREKNKGVLLDFETIPHLVVGGATRYGKSNFLNGLICSLLHSQPENVRFHLIDLKGGVELCDYERLKQTVSVAYEPEEALDTLRGAYEEMKAIQSRLRAMGKKNVQEAGIKTRHFIIIDEVGELNPEEAVDKKDIIKDGEYIHKSEKTIKMECQKYMSQIARLGAGLGMRQILATQYPTGDVIPRTCKQNSDAKLCFRVQSSVASTVVLDSAGAEELPEIKGRAIYQTADKRVIVQTQLITPEDILESVSPYNIKEEKPLESKEPAKPEAREYIVEFEETGLS